LSKPFSTNLLLLHKHGDFKLTAQYLVFPVQVSVTKCSHPQGTAVLENISSVLCKLSVVNGKLYT